ncbi:MAG: hypothetical protein M1819_002610 [Sarea resinae]|nr:MAG: hypothetical protein M1819_002610 [Sarea resinae]
MTKLILSTGNVMNGGPPIIRRVTAEKSNTELTASLRANFVEAQRSVSNPPTNGSSTETTNGVSADHASPDHPPRPSWTKQEGSTLYVPAIDFAQSGLAEEKSQYDITVKLFYLPSAPTSQRDVQTREAIDLVLKELHVPSIDLLILSFPGISFDADDEEESDEEAEEMNVASDGAVLADEDVAPMVSTWRTLEALHTAGTISQLGLAEFGSQRLARFLPHTKVRPSVDQINVRDCCVVPKSLILFAKHEHIELLTHNDCTNILPRGTVRELLGPGEKGAGVLAAGSNEEGQVGLRGELEPQWVVKYTAVVRDRGVVENKGYFAVAELKEGQ